MFYSLFALDAARVVNYGLYRIIVNDAEFSSVDY
jgi:hypothetical protein